MLNRIFLEAGVEWNIMRSFSVHLSSTDDPNDASLLKRQNSPYLTFSLVAISYRRAGDNPIPPPPQRDKNSDPRYPTVSSK